MQHLSDALSAIPAALTALNDNPLGTVALVALAALALVGYVIHKCV